jgi:hypothetical protein
MTEERSKPVVVHLDIRKLKPELETNLPSLSKAKLEALIEEAVVDAYNEDEQKVGLLTMMQEHLALPFSVSILGVEATVEKVDMTRDGRIVAVCRRDGVKQRIEILDLPLPKPAPAAAEWIAAYTHWRKGF